MAHFVLKALCDISLGDNEYFEEGAVLLIPASAQRNTNALPSQWIIKALEEAGFEIEDEDEARDKSNWEITWHGEDDEVKLDMNNIKG